MVRGIRIHRTKWAACITKYGPISRITLAHILGLSQGAVSRITSDLIHNGVIVETEPGETMSATLPKDFTAASNTERRGRPQTGLKLNCRSKTFVGIKLNGTMAHAVVVDAETISSPDARGADHRQCAGHGLKRNP